ncbi:MAG: SUMF1/EgtB/PvdO family nonheme iron enzyme, partial [Clostridia bacterium]
PVPEGFVVSSDTTENTIEQGLVIKQGDDPASTTSNEFVWVPVKNPLTDYKRGVTGDMTDINGNLTIGYFEDNTMSENMAIKNSVDKYNGFYIGRYETGLCDNARYSSTVIDGSNFINASPVVKKDAITWNYISQIRAVAESKKIYNTSNVHSTLINSYVWDTMLNYLIASGDKTQYQVVNNCSDFANYFNVEFLIDSNIKYSSDYGKTYQIGLTKKQLNTDYLLTTGATKRNSTKNIYDLAGNIWEWTTEKFNSNFGVFRGGSFAYGNSASTSYRDSLFNQSFSHFGLGFRCMIYMP